VAPVSDLQVDIRLKRFPAVGQAAAVTAIKDLQFAVRSGEFVCLLGPSGCGKTSSLNIIAGLDRDFDGSVALPRAADRPRPVIGYVFQTPRLLPWRTVEQNIALVLEPEQARSAIVDELLKATGLQEFRHTYPERLSVGMARRVALVRAFAVSPDLLLMDEPFVSLDESTAERLRALLLEIWQARPTTVLFVTHDTREAVQLADRVIVMTGSPASVQSIVAIDTPRPERAAPDVADRIRQRIVSPALASA
jgi:ABC-type nitrate/sulfonate/bicarbonate transport system ATPase subunit